jgi:hypothetical protein
VLLLIRLAELVGQLIIVSIVYSSQSQIEQFNITGLFVHNIRVAVLILLLLSVKIVQFMHHLFVAFYTQILIQLLLKELERGRCTLLCIHLFKVR